MSERKLALKTYWLIWLALMTLLGATWLVARFNLGPANVALALLISLVKMLLVMVWFMHLRVQSKTVWIFASAGFFWFLIMVTMTMNDYVSRRWNSDVQSAQPVSFYQAGDPKPTAGEIPGDAHSRPPTTSK